MKKYSWHFRQFKILRFLLYVGHNYLFGQVTLNMPLRVRWPAYKSAVQCSGIFLTSSYTAIFSLGSRIISIASRHTHSQAHTHPHTHTDRGARGRKFNATRLIVVTKCCCLSCSATLCLYWGQTYIYIDIHLNPFHSDCKTVFSNFLQMFKFIYQFLWPKHDCYIKFTSCFP